MINYPIGIKSFFIKNFRAFTNETIKFDFVIDSTHVLLGRNGTGKTTLLEALNICLSENSSKFNKIAETDFNSDEPITFTVEFTDFFFLSISDENYTRLLPCKKFTKTIKRRARKSPGEFFSSEYQIDVEYELLEYQRFPTRRDYNSFIEKYVEYLPENALIVWSLEKVENDYHYSIQSQTVHHVASREITYLEKVLFPQVFYFDKNRDRELETTYRTAFANIVQELDWRYKKELKTKDKKTELSDKYKSFHELVSSMGNYQEDLLGPATQILHEQFDLVDEFASFGFFFANCDKPFSNSTFGFQTEENKVISIKQIGSGLTILYALALLITFAENNKSPIILIIDEPELHLHADLQKKMMSLLQTKRLQKFISTHSPLFVNKNKIDNNYIFLRQSTGKVLIEKSNQLSLAETIFGLMGSRLDDLYIPERLLLVEGKYDKLVLIKVLTLLGFENKSQTLLSCGGYTEIPVKGKLLTEFFEKYFLDDTWYYQILKRDFRVICDGDVSDDTIREWISRFSLDSNRVNKLDKPGIEYLFPPELIKDAVSGKTLKNGDFFNSKSPEEIVTIILSDEKKRKPGVVSQDVYQKEEDLISKQRFNELVRDKLTLEMIMSDEGAPLRALAEWINTSGRVIGQ